MHSLTSPITFTPATGLHLGSPHFPPLSSASPGPTRSTRSPRSPRTLRPARAPIELLTRPGLSPDSIGWIYGSGQDSSYRSALDDVILSCSLRCETLPFAQPSFTSWNSLSLSSPASFAATRQATLEGPFTAGRNVHAFVRWKENWRYIYEAGHFWGILQFSTISLSAKNVHHFVSERHR